MRFTRNDVYNLLGIGLFIAALLGVWMWKYRQSTLATQQTAQKDALTTQAVNQMIQRPLTASAASSRIGLDLPYSVCYIPDVNDPTRWNGRPDTVTADSSIVRVTVAVPSQTVCDKIPDLTVTAVTQPVYDLRKNASTINEGFHVRADEVIKLFLERTYPGIEVQTDTIFKNLYQQAATNQFRLSVGAVYKKDGAFNVLIKDFPVSATGTLQNDPSQQPLDTIPSVVKFDQINRKGQTTITDTTLRYVLLSARCMDSPTNTLEVFTRAGFDQKIATLSLTNNQSSYLFVGLPESTTQLFLNVLGAGKIQVENFFTLTVPRAQAPSKVSHKFVMYKIISFFPLVTDTITPSDESVNLSIRNFPLGDPSEVEMRQGIIRRVQMWTDKSGWFNNQPQLWKQLYEMANRGDMQGVYIVPQLTSDKMDCTLYDTATARDWVDQYNRAKANSTAVKNAWGTLSNSAYLYWSMSFGRAYYGADPEDPNALKSAISSVRYHHRNKGQTKNIPGDIASQCTGDEY